MPEEWDLTKSDDRSEDQKTIFIIFCEDENDEPYYFRSLNSDNRLKINCIPNQRKAKLNLLSTLAYCQQEKLVECVDHALKIKEGIPQNVWCVYDRDLEDTNLTEIKAEDNLNFTTAVDTAVKSGLKVAWSNDAFELWILLHFEQVPADQMLHRDYIYNRLTIIFMKVPSVGKQYEDAINGGTFNYKKHLKRRIAFLQHVLPNLKDKVLQAIENAMILEKGFKTGVPYHQCNPCTRVHHLVNDILRALN